MNFTDALMSALMEFAGWCVTVIGFIICLYLFRNIFGYLINDICKSLRG